ncbi:MAG TPA: hypothetical protein VG652_04185 [Gaiellaceae bacterium]|nr:hypothetical protein [Gaiellaceae bacterium]
MSRRDRFAWAVPLLAGALLAAAIGAGAFALQATLGGPTAAQKLAARAVGRLDAMREARTSLTLDRGRAVPAVCVVVHARDEIQVGRTLRLQIVRAHVRRLSGPAQRPAQLAAIAALSACPRFLANGLNARLRADRATLVGTTRIHGRPDDIFDVSNHSSRPLVQLVMTRKNLVPIEVRFLGHRLTGRGKIIGMSRKTAKKVSLYFLKHKSLIPAATAP